MSMLGAYGVDLVNRAPRKVGLIGTGREGYDLTDNGPEAPAVFRMLVAGGLDVTVDRVALRAGI